MKINGSWEYDEQMVENLNLIALFRAYLKTYNENRRKAMTAAMIGYLEKEYPEEKEELKLVLEKAKYFLEK